MYWIDMFPSGWYIFFVCYVDLFWLACWIWRSLLKFIAFLLHDCNMFLAIASYLNTENTFPEYLSYLSGLL